MHNMEIRGRYRRMAATWKELKSIDVRECVVELNGGVQTTNLV
jgi:hypothetical protein